VPAYELVLGGGAPQYTREYKEPAYLQEIARFSINDVPDVKDGEELRNIAEQIIQLPNIASKRWISVQYDSMVGAANAGTNAPSDAAVVLARGTGKALAMTVDCNSRYVYANPQVGASIAVAEAARNIVCSGGEPIGVTNCLNFGNPYNPEVYYQFVKAVTGMGEACRAFNTPVTGGNVSFYNQNPDGPIYPTPTIGMVGVLDNINNHMTLDFKRANDVILLIGKVKNDIASSEYINKIRGVEYSPAPYFNLEEEKHLHEVIAALIKSKAVQSVHDVSEGGVLVTLMESGFSRGLGFDVWFNNHSVDEMNERNDAFWFGEAQGRVIVSVADEHMETFLSHIENAGIETVELGQVTTGDVLVNGDNWGNINEWKYKYDTAIEKLIEA
jgi:phosphoribosylformylglycinamidine synthase